MTIETNDVDVPLIIYYKPKIKKEEQRQQAVVRIAQTCNRIQLAKYYQSFSKLELNAVHSSHSLTKASLLARLFDKIKARKETQTVTSLTVNNVKARQVQSSCKLLASVSSSLRLKNIRHAFNEIKHRWLKAKIKELS